MVRRLFAIILSALALYISQNIYLSAIVTACALYNLYYVIRHVLYKVKTRKAVSMDKEMLFCYSQFILSIVAFVISVSCALNNPVWLILSFVAIVINIYFMRYLLMKKRKELMKMQKGIERGLKKWVLNSIYRV